MVINKKVVIILIIILSTILGSCNNKLKCINSYLKDSIIEINQLKIPEEDEEIAIIKTSKGDIKMRLFSDAAPMVVKNFKALAKEGFYEGYEFSRIEDNFLIQIQDPPIAFSNRKDEYEKLYDDEISHKYHHFLGAVGLAKKDGVQSSSIFYIITRENLLEEDLDFLKDNPNELSEKEINAFKTIGGVPRLDYQYIVFGQVYEGLDTLVEISKVSINETTFEPLEKVFINEIIIERIVE